MTDKNLLINLWRIWSFLESSSVFFPTLIWMIWQNTNKHIKTLWYSLLAYAYTMEKTDSNLRKTYNILSFPYTHVFYKGIFSKQAEKELLVTKHPILANFLHNTKKRPITSTNLVLEHRFLKFPSLGWLGFWTIFFYRHLLLNHTLFKKYTPNSNQIKEKEKEKE